MFIKSAAGIWGKEAVKGWFNKQKRSWGVGNIKSMQLMKQRNWGSKYKAGLPGILPQSNQKKK